MFWLVNKKELKNTLKSSLGNLNKLLHKLTKDHSRNKQSIEKNSIKIARLEGVISVLVKEKSQSQSIASPKQVSHHLETKMIQRLRSNRQSIVMGEITKLIPSYSVREMYELIVIEKRLCSKATFYRYINILRSRGIIKTKTNETEQEIKTDDRD